MTQPGLIHSGVAADEFFRYYLDRGEPLVLATVAQTLGSTYRKAGAQMLIAGDGRVAGLLSGGCLEADLMERARRVLETGEPATVHYDTRSSDDVIWGIGLGCEGAMTILLSRLDRANDYQPFKFASRCRFDQVDARFALVTESRNPKVPLGAAFWSQNKHLLPASVATAMDVSTPRGAGPSSQVIEAGDATFLIVPIELPPRLLLLGGGPDAMPLVEIAGLMNWQVTVFDHRAAYAIADRFPRARRVELKAAAELPRELQAGQYDAAVVMSHHLLSDQAYLAALADSSIPYVGLLGPAPRRIRLLHEIGDKAARLSGRLYGPIGLDIGARSPETIALAIVAEIQAAMAGREGGSFSKVVPTA
ncbi:XdhC family protein [Steroidobacter sp. S1-65]|uniref:XdhC family protein n=1 Tax=Steroidobacter gossypii TaxID=2805490 RepID=A0ABS1X1K2_9GAMM|nr:XdhC/CoxI family protein [Steroidobacter gossypii]MBM0107096.1 XdhC family protein [Steroidobacter gossypii]